MRPFTSFAAILASSSLISAFPAPDGQGISLKMVKRAGAQFSANVLSLMPGNEKWTVDIQVGNQTLPIVVDTGSHDFWVESNLTSPQAGSNHPIYTPALATRIAGATWTASFDQPTPVVAAAGVGYSDQIVIGGATVTNQVVGAVTTLANPTPNVFRKSGIIGLSHAINQVNYGGSITNPRAVMKNLYDQRGISAFTLDLRTDNTGTLDLGYIDPSKYTGNITYTNLRPNSANWYIPVDSYSINDVQQPEAPSGNTFIHPDSGAPYINLHPTAVMNYYSKIPGSSNSNGLYRFPCSAVKAGLPSLGLSFAGTRFTVPGNWMWQSQSGNTCVGALQNASSTSYAVAGDMFLRTVFAVFDLSANGGSGRVGFAVKNLPTAPVPK